MCGSRLTSSSFWWSSLGRVAADLVAVLLQRGEGGRVDLGLDLGLGHRVVDGGLEVLEVEHRVGLLERGGLLGADLQVVRLLAGLGQAGDVHMVPAYLLGEEGHRVERRDDVELARAGRGRAVGGAGGEGAEAEGGGGRDRGAGYESSCVHDSHFQQIWKPLSTSPGGGWVRVWAGIRFGRGGVPAGTLKSSLEAHLASSPVVVMKRAPWPPTRSTPSSA